MDAVDSDKIQAQAVENGADPESGATEAQLETARHQLVNRAIMPIAASPALRNFLMEREILIDETSQDEVMERGFDNGASERARQLIESFQGFIQENQDKITALQILYNRPTPGRLDYACCAICEPEQAAASDRPAVLTESLWQAYQKLERDRVRGVGQQRILADLVSLVRHAAQGEELEPYPQRVERRYQEWLRAKQEAGVTFTPQQRWWLDEIARHIGINISISLDDLNSFGFQQHGGELAAKRIFGLQLETLLEELNHSIGI